jgi:hypothetical protein
VGEHQLRFTPKRVVNEHNFPSCAQCRASVQMGNSAFEKHYRVKELARLWGLSPKTITREFSNEASVIRVASGGTSKRKYTTLSIPESVALRVHERLSHNGLQATRTRRNPRRIVLLRNLNRGVTEQARDVTDADPAGQSPDSESITEPMGSAV